MARNRSEVTIHCPDPRVIVHPDNGEHRLHVNEINRGDNKHYWRAEVRSPGGHLLRAAPAIDLAGAIKIYNDVPSVFWFESQWVGPVPQRYQTGYNYKAAIQRQAGNPDD